ncbi:hypothetical protein AURDEDRAFT_180265, partial [Auricularia subglabra TFB-10046 SS5]
MSAQLTRDEFGAACDAFLVRASCSPPGDATAAIRGHLGWSLVVSPVVPTLRCLTRTASVHAVSREEADDSADLELEEGDDDEDDAVVSQVTPQTFYTVQQWVAYSPTYRVPVFYFTCHDANGAPVPLEALVSTSLFHSRVAKTVKHTAHSLDLPEQDAEHTPFPLLSQGDHPVLGFPCWFLHPCETPAAMAELLHDSAN